MNREIGWLHRARRKNLLFKKKKNERKKDTNNLLGWMSSSHLTHHRGELLENVEALGQKWSGRKKKKKLG